MSSAFVNMIIPIAVMAAAALALPYLLTPRETRSHKRLVLSMAATALVLILLGPILYVVFDPRDIYDAASLAEMRVIGRIVFVESLTAAIVWVPLLFLVWIGRAQQVEKLRGQDMLRNPNPAGPST